MALTGSDPPPGGRVARVRGSVVDVDFGDSPPAIDNLLVVPESSIALEVVAHPTPGPSGPSP